MCAPKMPDPKETAEAQGKINKETAIAQFNLNSVNQNTPWGNSKWTQTGTREDGTPIMELTTSLTPGLQKVNDNLVGAAGDLSTSVRGAMGTPVTTTGLTQRAGTVRAPSLQAYGASLTNKGNPTYSAPGVSWDAASGAIGDAGAIQKNVGANDWSADRARVEEAVLSRQAPAWEADRKRQEADLASRGVMPGTVAYDRAMDQLRRQQNDARSQAILTGGQEQSRMADLELAQAGFRNSAQAQDYGQQSDRARFRADVTGQNNATGLTAQRQKFDQETTQFEQNFNRDLLRDTFAREGTQLNNGNMLQEFGAQLQSADQQNATRDAELQERFAISDHPINRLAALLSGSQISQPNLSSTPSVGVNGVDYTKLVGDNYNAQMQGYSGLLGGIGSLGAGLLKLLPTSDRRLKSNIRQIGTADNGLPIYLYEKFGKLEVGFMADEVEKVHPDAVGEFLGFKIVDYEKAVL